jgi:hypothetical protein
MTDPDPFYTLTRRGALQAAAVAGLARLGPARSHRPERPAEP